MKRTKCLTLRRAAWIALLSCSLIDGNCAPGYADFACITALPSPDQVFCAEASIEYLLQGETESVFIGGAEFGDTVAAIDALDPLALVPIPRNVESLNAQATIGPPNRNEVQVSHKGVMRGVPLAGFSEFSARTTSMTSIPVRIEAPAGTGDVPIQVDISFEGTIEDSPFGPPNGEAFNLVQVSVRDALADLFDTPFVGGFSSFDFDNGSTPKLRNADFFGEDIGFTTPTGSEASFTAERTLNGVIPSGTDAVFDVFVSGGMLFTDGFESGDALAWGNDYGDTVVVTLSSSNPNVQFVTAVPEPGAGYLLGFVGLVAGANQWYRRRQQQLG